MKKTGLFLVLLLSIMSCQTSKKQTSMSSISEKTIQATIDSVKVHAPETNATMISVWDDKKFEALRIDLWTKDMPVDQMKVFLHQIFVSLGHTYQRATGEDDVADKIQEFAEEFALMSKIK